MQTLKYQMTMPKLEKLVNDISERIRKINLFTLRSNILNFVGGQPLPAQGLEWLAEID